MTFPEACQYLNDFINREFDLHHASPRDFRLDRVERLLEALGNPQHCLKFLHVAGTTGKGSTCLFTASILSQAGYRTGLYTSPHLYDFTERIRILDSATVNDDSPFAGKITPEELSALVNDATAAIEHVRMREKGRLTFFEVYTALAIFHFQRQKVDWAVLETGLGGRLDATNAVQSLICAITSIDLEHTQLLGTTLAAIAAEKAAIIKNERQTVVVAPQEPEAAEVIRQRCRVVGARAVWLGQDIRYRWVSAKLFEQIFDMEGIGEQYSGLKIHLLGRHQIMNAATAVAMAESLKDFGCLISPDHIRRGLAQAVWPGRFEIVDGAPIIVLDGAHHPGGVAALARTMREVFPDKKITVVLGCAQDKDTKGICRNIREIADRIVLTRADHPRSVNFREENIPDLLGDHPVLITDQVAEAFAYARRITAPQDVILITGSLFVIGEARKLCIK